MMIDYDSLLGSGLSARGINCVAAYAQANKLTDLKEVKKLLTEKVASTIKNSGEITAREIAIWAGHKTALCAITYKDNCCGLPCSTTFCPHCGQQLKEDNGASLLRYLKAQALKVNHIHARGAEISKYHIDKWNNWIKFVETAIKNQKDGTP